MRRRLQKSGFTLIELILVMMIIALIATMVAPRLRGFSIGRRSNDAAREIVGMAHYARTQAITEGRLYRLNFDVKAEKFWLTAEDDTGAFVAPSGDIGEQVTLPDGVQMDAQITPQTNVQLDTPNNVQQQVVPGTPSVTQPGLQPVPLVANVRDQSQVYVEFQPSGRTDPATITFTDALRGVIQITCPTVTDQFEILPAAEVK